MDPAFERFARATFERAGIAVSDDDLALVELIHTGYDSYAAALAAADVAQFPFEPIDPRRPPGP